MKINELKRAMALAMGAIMPEPEDEAGKEKAKDKFTVQPNRAMLRRMTGGRHVPASEFRPGTVEHAMAGKHQRRKRTGRPAHVRGWEQAAAIRKHLLSVRTANLATRIEDHAVASAFALLIDFAPTAWDIARSNKKSLLAVPGMGPVNLRRVHGYLTSHNVALDWDVA